MNNNLDDELPQEILDLAEEATLESLPANSLVIYESSYKSLIDWKTKMKVSFEEKVLMAYFKQLSEKLSPSTLWSKYSMLKTMIYHYLRIRIDNYNKLKNFVKVKNKGYKAKQAEVFTPDDMKKFFNTAPDTLFLDTKVNKIVFFYFKILILIYF